jgi:hypothetical protein
MMVGGGDGGRWLVGNQEVLSLALMALTQIHVTKLGRNSSFCCVYMVWRNYWAHVEMSVLNGMKHEKHTQTYVSTYIHRYIYIYIHTYILT